jgi:hypothetical protein
MLRSFAPDVVLCATCTVLVASALKKMLRLRTKAVMATLCLGSTLAHKVFAVADAHFISSTGGEGSPCTRFDAVTSFTIRSFGH